MDPSAGRASSHEQFDFVILTQTTLNVNTTLSNYRKRNSALNTPQHRREPRTSHTDPLRIDVAIAPGGGSLGLTFCPGKKQLYGMTGAWDRDLSLDLDVIQSWGATIVCTLMEQFELEAVQAHDIGASATQRGMLWLHMPIIDGDVPDRQFEIFWTYYGLRLRQALRNGEKILIHCLGGLGRTGIIAARLFIELGMAPDVALTSVRAARADAVENELQEAYVRKLRPGVAQYDLYYDRMLGCLLGGAVGDAFGYAVEFDTLTKIRAKFGPSGITVPVLNKRAKLVVSDDTQMTLFTLEGITCALHSVCSLRELNPKALVARVRDAYMDWFGTQIKRPSDQTHVGWLALQPALQAQRAPGGTCLSALQDGGQGTPEEPINDSKGCGAAMRAAPIGFVPMLAPIVETRPRNAGAKTRLPSECRAIISELAAGVSALTHGHPDGWGSAVIVASIISHAVSGTSLPDAVTLALEDLASFDRYNKTDQDIYRRAVNLATHSEADPACQIAKLGEGWVGEEAVAIAIYAALSQSTFKDVIICAANHDGDSDSTASIAGQLWGAAYGITHIPNEWIEKLDVVTELLVLANDMIRLTSAGHSIS